MTRTTHFKLILFTTCVWAFFSSCRTTGKEKVGFVVTTLSNPYFVDMTDAAKAEAAKHANIELLVQAPERATDSERQIQIMENFVTQGAKIICVVPSDSKSIVPAIAKANRANIPVIVLDNRIDDAVARAGGIMIASFIGSDNVLGGRLAGEFVVNKVAPVGTVAILEGVTGVEAAVQRKAGFLEAIKSSPGIKLVASQPADWDREKGLNVTLSILQVNPKLSAIFACNDEMALGAVQAVNSLNAKSRPVIVGFDATKDGIAAVRSGSMAATVAQLPAEVGRLGVEEAVELLAGHTIQPVIPTQVKLITPDSIPK